MNAERSVSTVVQEIVHNLQDIVRAEVRLARAEIGEDARRVAWSVAWIAGGAVIGLSATMFVLWTLAYLLAMAMPMWAATLVVAVAMAAIAGGLILGGLHRLKQVRPIPERTVESMRENIAWIKHPAK